MVQYLIKRILIFIPTLLLISLIAFGLSKMAPGDPVDTPDGGVENSIVNTEKIYEERAEFLGLNKPAFYVAFTSRAYPDTLYKILKKDRRATVSKLVAQYGNWPQIQTYYEQVRQVELLMEHLETDTLRESLRQIRPSLRLLYLSYRHKRISSLLETIESKVETDSLIMHTSLPGAVERLKRDYLNVRAECTKHLLYIPDIKWHGWDNQYHNWLTCFLMFDFGVSYYDGRPVSSRMKDALFWTIILNLLAIFFAYLLSIPLGVFSAIWKDSVFDRSTTLLLFILYSLPSFWIATMLVVFFTTPEYGMDWFPSLGTGELPPEVPFLDRFFETATHLILPVFCLTYSALAFISRQVRGGMLNVIRQDYIRTAWAKGLGSRSVVWNHAFRNALFPIITMFANIFPAVFAGSVVIEVIFNIPGMGKLTVEAIFQRDWPVVYTVLMLSATLTMVGILLADVLYALVDPRVSYRIKKR